VKIANPTSVVSAKQNFRKHFVNRVCRKSIFNQSKTNQRMQLFPVMNVSSNLANASVTETVQAYSKIREFLTAFLEHVSAGVTNAIVLSLLF